MKRYFLSAAVVLMTVTSYAQFTRGTMMIGGSVGFEYNKIKDKSNSVTIERSRTFTCALEPQFGIFVANNFVIGGGLGFELLRNKTYGYYDYSESSTRILSTLEPFVRYYLPQRIFFQGKFIVGVGQVYLDAQDDGSSGTVIGGTISAGYSIPLNERIALEPQIGYQSNAYKDSGSDVKSMDNSLFLRAGFQIYLRR